MSKQGEHGISWTDETWNPIRGCSRVSPGCMNCYAERQAYRFSGAGEPYEGLVRIANGHPQWTGVVRTVDEHMEDPLHWKRPRMIFVNSMSDLFHDDVADETIDRIFAVMGLSRQHTFQVLTKRPARMFRYMMSRGKSIRYWEDAARAMGYTFKFNGLDGIEHSICPFPLRNVWLGVSVENQDMADYRIPILLETPAAIRWISAEPLLGPVDAFITEQPCLQHRNGRIEKRTMLDWVVCGGESGPRARPMHPVWARSLRDQCIAADVAFHFKQWGQWRPIATPRLNAKVGDTQLIHLDGSTAPATWCDVMNTRGDLWAVQRVGKRKAGRLLDGREWNEYPEVKRG